MDQDMTLIERLESGDLMDYTDIAEHVGFKWPTLVEAKLEAAIQKSLPEVVQLAISDPDREESNENAMGAALHEVFTAARDALAEAVQNPELGSASAIGFEHVASWKPGMRLNIRVAIETDAGQPHFVLGVIEG
jgi:hypothetical protein